MEWMLQVVDELDDMAGAMRHLWIGVRRDIAILAAGIAGAVALLGLIALGAGPFLLVSGGLLLSAMPAFAIQRRRNQSEYHHRLPLVADRSSNRAMLHCRLDRPNPRIAHASILASLSCPGGGNARARRLRPLPFTDAGRASGRHRDAFQP